MGALDERYCSPILLSLWEMIKADVSYLAFAIGQMHRCVSLCGPDAEVAGAGIKKTVTSAYEIARKEFEKYGLLTASDRLTKGANWLANIPNYPNGDLKRDLQETIYSAESELKRIYFAHVAGEKANEILKAEMLWGNGIVVFISAKKDALEASFCYALGRNEACVHHCMMVLERGFDALAHKLGFDPGARSWGTVIDDLEKEIDKRQKALKAKKPSDLLTFLAAAAREFTYFKDAWRNHSAHGRADYDENDARKVLTHTRDFMDHLATRLKDRKR